MDFKAEREKQECLQALISLRSDTLDLKENMFNSILCKAIRKENFNRLANAIDSLLNIIGQETIGCLTCKPREGEQQK